MQSLFFMFGLEKHTVNLLSPVALINLTELSTARLVLTVRGRHSGPTQITLRGHKKHQILSLLLSGTPILTLNFQKCL